MPVDHGTVSAGEVDQLNELFRGENVAQSEPIWVTLLSVRGSNYRRAGAHMVVFEDGSTRGLLSGGCLEEAVAQRARQVKPGDPPHLWEMDTRPYSGCDGRLTLLAERTPGLFAKVATSLEERRCDLFLLTDRRGGTRITNQPEAEVDLCCPLLPSIRLVVVGGGPDSGVLLELARALDWTTEWWCHPGQRRAEAACQALSPELVTHTLKGDARTAVVLMNHHLGRDAAYLRALWQVPLGYLASIGSRARREELLAHLWEAGLDPEGRPFFCPAGIRLGGEGPAAVALSVLAQIQDTL